MIVQQQRLREVVGMRVVYNHQRVRFFLSAHLLQLFAAAVALFGTCLHAVKSENRRFSP